MKKKRLLSLCMAAALLFGSAVALPEGVFDDAAGIVASAESTTRVSGDYEYQILENGTAQITKYNGAGGEVTIPSVVGGRSVTSIGYLSFSDCDKLVSVIIPDSVLSVETSAFYKCRNLLHVSFGNNVQSIDSIAFAMCEHLTDLTIPNSVKYIGDGAFLNCEELLSVSIPKSVVDFGAAAFLNTKWLKIQQESDPLVIINDVLIDASCYNESRLDIPQGVKRISYVCNSTIKSVTIPNSVIKIGDSGFENCSALTSVALPEGILSIGDYAFYRCPNLKSIEIPKSVSDIGSFSFGYGEDEDTFEKYKIYGFIINCERDTVAEKYAIDNSISFKLIDIPYDITRLAGKGRYKTAAMISQAAFDQADTVVLAYGLNYADALAGVSLAKAMNAPILLTNLKTLPAETLAEIKRLKAKNVIILGGTGAVGAEVETALIKEGFKTKRIAGASRFGTATAIAEKLTDAPTDVFFVYAFNSADALSVSPIAASKNAPIIYLTTKGELNADTAAYLAKLKKAGCVKNAYVIGGEGVISNDMMKKAGSALGVTPVRVFGANRFETCVAVNERFADVLDGDMLCVATGMDFPDALAGGVFAALNKAPLFLVNGKSKTLTLSESQKSYLKSKSPQKIYTFGGTGAVPDNHVKVVSGASV